MVPKVIERRVRSGKYFDPEASEQCSSPKTGVAQSALDDIVVSLGCIGTELHIDSEDVGECPIEPQTGRGSPEHVIVAGERIPDLAGIGLHGCAIASRYSEPLQRHTQAVEHAQQVVVRRDQQAGGIAEAHVIGEPLRIRMAVRTYDRQPLDVLIQAASHAACVRIGREQAVRVQHEALCHGSKSAPLTELEQLARTV